MRERRFRRAFEFGNDRLRERLAEFYAPLVERVDVPDGALREDAVLVERDQRAERGGREAFCQNHVRRAVALEDAVRHERRRRTLRLHLLGGLAERERLGLREDVGEQQVVVAAARIQRLGEGDEVAGDQPRALVSSW